MSKVDDLRIILRTNCGENALQSPQELQHHILIQNPAGGRSTSYALRNSQT